MADFSHEEKWMLNQEARLKGVRPDARIVWQDGGTQEFYHRGYYIVWTQSDLVGLGRENWACYAGIGDAATQVRIENWITKHKRG